MVSKIHEQKVDQTASISGMFFEEMGIGVFGIGGRWQSSWNCEAFKRLRISMDR